MRRPGLGFAVLALLLGLTTGVAQAAEAVDAELEAVRDRVQKLLPEVSRENVRRSPAAGLFEVQRGTAFGYVTADAKYLLRGDLIDVTTGTVLTEASRRGARAEAVKALGARAIEFAPPPDFIEHTVYVYADVDCNYCRQLHAEVRQMNARGIAVRYLFYPRFGPQSEPFRRAQSAYCAPEPAKTLEQLFGGGVLKNARSDCDNPVLEQYNAAVAMGVKGTPMTVLPDGSTVYGYISAQALADALAKLKSPAASP